MYYSDPILKINKAKKNIKLAIIVGIISGSMYLYGYFFGVPLKYEWFFSDISLYMFIASILIILKNYVTLLVELPK